MCGEKTTQRVLKDLVPGSPPRMRGKVWYCLRDLDLTGITPAHAGKSQGLADIYEVLGDHPRVCGEKPAHWQKHRT